MRAGHDAGVEHLQDDRVARRSETGRDPYLWW